MLKQQACSGLRPAAASLLMTLWVPAVASAADFYVDPQSGSPTNDGTQASPWSTLAEVQDRIGSDVQGGDTVHLLSGYHGEVQLSGISVATAIIIEAEDGHEPHLGRLSIQGSSGVTVRGVWVSPEYAASYSNETIVSISDDSSAVIVEGLTIQSVADASGWSDADWDQLSANGISVGGDDITVRDNTVPAPAEPKETRRAAVVRRPMRSTASWSCCSRSCSLRADAVEPSFSERQTSATRISDGRYSVPS